MASFKDLGEQQRDENLSVAKNDYRHVRRIMDINNKTSIRVAAEVTNTMSVNKAVVDRLKSYVSDNSVGDGIKRVSLQEALSMEDKKVEWTPCRFATLGWKYQQQGTFNKFLNQSYKINSMGGLGPIQTQDQLINTYFPQNKDRIEHRKVQSLQEQIEKANKKISNLNKQKLELSPIKTNYFQKYNQQDFEDKSQLN